MTKVNTNSLPWFVKHRPRTLKNFYGQEEAVDFLKKYILNFKKFLRGKKKSVLLFGPSGCGKTSLVYALANDLGLEVVELNASDFRNKQEIDSIVGNAINQRSLFARGKIILIDELEGVSGTQDRGGLQEIARFIEKTHYPIVLTVGFVDDPKEVPWSSKFNTIKRLSFLIKMNPLSSDVIFKILKRICDAENIKVDDSLLRKISRIEAGDVRAAINDLEVLAKSGMLDDSGIKLLDYRDKDESIKKHLLKIFKSSNPMDALQDNDFDIDTKILWLDENLPLEYSNKALFEAYEIMSFADILRARIRRRQHWRFLVAINTLLTFGISSVKQWAGSNNRVRGIVDYKPPSRILKMWIYKNKLMRKKSIAEKLALKQHSSLEEAEQNVIFLKVMMKNKDYKDKIVEELGLTKEEVEWLEK